MRLKFETSNISFSNVHLHGCIHYTHLYNLLKICISNILGILFSYTFNINSAPLHVIRLLI